MIKKLLILIAAIVVAFVAYVAAQPSSFSVVRTAEIAAPAEVIFPHVNSPRKAHEWSPWTKLDPNMTMTFEGAESGEGAIAKWKGNHEVGEGIMSITESTPPTEVQMWLEFIEPFPGSADASIKLEPSGSATKVTWAMSGNSGFFERAMCTLMGIDMDQVIGEKYQEGLANLKKIVEGSGPA